MEFGVLWSRREAPERGVTRVRMGVRASAMGPGPGPVREVPSGSQEQRGVLLSMVDVEGKTGASTSVWWCKSLRVHRWDVHDQSAH